IGFTDLHPNIGVYWYFFMEMFKEFEIFFLAVFHLNTMVFIAPITYKFRDDPLFATSFIMGIMASLKAYPSWGDLGLALTYLIMNEELLKYLQYVFPGAGLIVAGSILSPSFWKLWIVLGSGNANFYYAATLVYNLGILLLVVDFASAKARRNIDMKFQNARTKKIYQK
ncbi:hypothetical protein BB558_007105, partial [Smittium angustum]